MTYDRPQNQSVRQVINPETAKEIRELIKAFVEQRQDSPEMTELQRTASKHELLPLVFAWDPICIDPSGEIISFAWDDHDSRNTETDPRIVNGILFQGIKRYPELGELMPIRTDNDIECSYCAGTGLDPIAMEINQVENIVRYCGGLGWIPKESN